MSRQYPIWNQINSCAYSSDKSYGARIDSAVTVRIGSSGSNSHKFVNHVTTKDRTTDEKHGDVIRFRFWVCGALIKEALYTVSKHGTADTLIIERCAWIGAVCHKRIEQRSAA